jgi:hypothetical protein
MSTLQEDLKHRRMAEPPPARSCESAKEPVHSLQIDSWSDGKWVLPWSHFVAAHHQGTGEDEQLVLSFTNHEVRLQGVRLVLLLPEIASLRLDCLRELPPKFLGEADETQPIIRHVSVRCLAESHERNAQTS